MNLNDTVNHEMLDHFTSTLDKAREDGEKVMILGHTSPGLYSLDVFSIWLNEVMLEYSDVITLHVYGHTHRDHYTLVKSKLVLKNYHINRILK